MIPQILIGRGKKSIAKFVENYIKQYHFIPERIFNMYPTGKEFSVDQVRDIRKLLVVGAGGRRLFVLNDFGKASFEAQNALLKTLEESTEENDFLIICEHEKQLLPTVRSRAKLILLKESKEKAVFDKEFTSTMEDVMRSQKYRFLSSPLCSGKTRDGFIEFLDEVIGYFRLRLNDGDSVAAKVLKKMISIRQQISENNINAQLAVDNLLIFVNRTYSMKKDGEK